MEEPGRASRRSGRASEKLGRARKSPGEARLITSGHALPIQSMLYLITSGHALSMQSMLYHVVSDHVGPCSALSVHVRYVCMHITYRETYAFHSCNYDSHPHTSIWALAFAGGPPECMRGCPCMSSKSTAGSLLLDPSPATNLLFKGTAPSSR